MLSCPIMDWQAKSRVLDEEEVHEYDRYIENHTPLSHISSLPLVLSGSMLSTLKSPVVQLESMAICSIMMYHTPGRHMYILCRIPQQ